MAETVVIPQADSGSALSGLPWWAKVIGIVGIPGAISMFTVVTITNALPGLQTELISLRLEAERTRLLYQANVAAAEETRRLLQRICTRISRTDEERSQCFDR